MKIIEDDGIELVFKQTAYEKYFNDDEYYDYRNKAYIKDNIKSFLAGDLSSELEHCVRIIKENGLFGIREENGMEIIPCIFEDIDYTILKNGKYIFFVKLNDKYGVIDEDGNILAPCIYDSIDNYGKDYTAVSKGTKTGLINPDGEEVIPCEHRKVWYDEEADKVQVIDQYVDFYSTSGELIAKTEYDAVYGFSRGTALTFKDGKFGLIDFNFNTIISPKYDKAEESNQAIEVKDINGWGLISKAGETLIPCSYDSIDDIFYQDENFVGASVSENEKKLFITGDGQKIEFEPSSTLSEAFFIKEDNTKNYYFKVEQNDKIGVMNQNGDLIIPCIYDKIYPADCGLLSVSKDCKAGVIDINNCVVVPTVYFGTNIFGKDLIRVVNHDMTFELVNSRGEMITDEEYEVIASLKNDLYLVEDDGLRVGIINEKGEVILPCKFYDLEIFDDGIIRASEDEKCYQVEDNGDIIEIPDIITKIKVSYRDLPGGTCYTDKRKENLSQYKRILKAIAIADEKHEYHDLIIDGNVVNFASKSERMLFMKDLVIPDEEMGPKLTKKKDE